MPWLQLVRSGGEVRPPGERIDLDATQPVLYRAPLGLPRESAPVRCIRCDGRMERGTAPVLIERGGCRLAWEAVPAWVCTRCEAPYFEQREVALIRRALSLLREAAAAPSRA